MSTTKQLFGLPEPFGWVGVWDIKIKNVVQSFKQDDNKMSIKHFGELAKQFRW